MSEFVQEFWRIVANENPSIIEALGEEIPSTTPKTPKSDAYSISVINNTITTIESMLNDAINKPLTQLEQGIRNATRIIEQTRALGRKEEIAELTPELSALLFEIASISAALLVQNIFKIAEEKMTVSSLNSLRQTLEMALNYIYKFKLKPSTG